MSDAYTPIRVKYFGGKYIVTDDFNTDQLYHRNGRQLFNSGVFTPGVVEGLTVKPDSESSPTTVNVLAGRALDDCGRLLVLAKDVTIPLNNVVSGVIYSIVIEYAEDDEDGGAGGADAARVVEKPSVILVARSPAKGEVLLATLSRDDKGKILFNSAWGSSGQRRHLGAILGSIEFPLETALISESWSKQPDPAHISIAAYGYTQGNSPVLEVTAPYIALNGEVSACGGSLTVDGELTVDKTVEVRGMLTADVGIDVKKGVKTNTLTVTGASLLEGDTTIGGSLTFSGDLKLKQGLDVTGKLTAEGGLGVTGGAATDTLDVVGTGAGDALTVTGDSSLTGKLNVSGDVSASNFIGNGSGLTNLPSSVWQHSGDNIYFKRGNVGIGVTTPSSLLTVKGNAGAQIGSGLVTLGDSTGDGCYTLLGYQTGFQKELKDGDSVLTFGSIQEQEVEIAQVDGKHLTLKEPFPFSVGWCDLKYRRDGGPVQTPTPVGQFQAEGVSVKGDDTADFSVLKSGDTLVISSFVSQSKDQWKVISVSDEATAVIKNLTSNGVGSAPPNSSAFAISTSRYAVDVVGGATVDSLSAGEFSCLDATGKNGFVVSAGTVQCLNFYHQTVALVGPTKVSQWNVSSAFSGDAIVTATLVPVTVDAQGNATPLFSQRLIPSNFVSDVGTFVLCSGLNLTANDGTDAFAALDGQNVSGFARTSVSASADTTKNMYFTGGSLTLAVRKGENIFYGVEVPPGLPDKVGVYFSTWVLGAGAQALMGKDAATNDDKN